MSAVDIKRPTSGGDCAGTTNPTTRWADMDDNAQDMPRSKPERVHHRPQDDGGDSLGVLRSSAPPEPIKKHAVYVNPSKRHGGDNVYQGGISSTTSQPPIHVEASPPQRVMMGRGQGGTKSAADWGPSSPPVSPGVAAGSEVTDESNFAPLLGPRFLVRIARKIEECRRSFRDEPQDINTPEWPHSSGHAAPHAHGAEHHHHHDVGYGHHNQQQYWGGSYEGHHHAAVPSHEDEWGYQNQNQPNGGMGGYGGGYNGGQYQQQRQPQQMMPRRGGGGGRETNLPPPLHGYSTAPPPAPYPQQHQHHHHQQQQQQQQLPPSTSFSMGRGRGRAGAMANPQYYDEPSSMQQQHGMMHGQPQQQQQQHSQEQSLPMSPPSSSSGPARGMGRGRGATMMGAGQQQQQQIPLSQELDLPSSSQRAGPPGAVVGSSIDSRAWRGRK